LHRPDAGFSLVEVMCALLILAVAIVGLTQGVTAALSATKESEVQTEAALLAAGQIEILRAEDFLVDGVTEGDGGEGLALYHWKQTVAKGDIDGLHTVEVVVENKKSGKQIYSLETMLFQAPDASASPGPTSRKSSSSSKARSRKREGTR